MRLPRKLNRSIRPSDPQPIRDPIDVVETACDQVNLQDCPVVEAEPAQLLEILWQ